MTGVPDRSGAKARGERAILPPGTEKSHPVAKEKLAAELREAALRARQFASSLKSPQSKESFLALAAKWEAEARAIESGR